ncbi:putative membrane protein of unknown function [Chloroherpeton thalassium ATCC 35110]|uniref:Glycosyltransferase RgtA/B/C/D-like domain-containing protein n=1 Tax=Chloroherpeton thalassium (strain ATCC 35110 / GB-78) TaxID=517418 RepID=B3QT74_CHLT3|nr:hypothetical protein [Chloroherpeton thalassium]ACF14173.1 putative membrane protein of unknown function [Chloroherpeton thalassium ATCC 35110]
MLLALVLFEYILILKVNQGHFVFTLDDPYIHLALAENLLKGHYGVNLGEQSAPASSILWPFLIAPFTAFQSSYLAPFFLNVVFALATLWVASQIVATLFSSEKIPSTQRLLLSSFFLTMFILLSNLIGLIYIGMEHTLQVFFTLLVIWGIFRHLENKQAPIWFLVAVVLGPLVRYENLAISFAAIFYLFFVGEQKISIALGVEILILLGGFSGFLLSQGLEYLPTSVKAKSSLVNYGSKIEAILRNGEGSFTTARGILLSVCSLFLLHQTFLTEKKYEERIFAFGVAIAVIFHIFFGAYGWHNRYEIYVLTSAILALLFLNREALVRISKNHFPYLIIFSGLFTVFLAYPNIKRLVKIQVSSNEIYQQQYQMHRFAAEYYKKPVAVNDLGYVSYQNKNYVLDLNGLASLEALHFRSSGAPCEWMNELAVKKNVRFAMIYDSWFKEHPKNWIKVAELDLGRITIAAAGPKVAFYALDKETAVEVKGCLLDYKKALPDGVEFTILK